MPKMSSSAIRADPFDGKQIKEIKHDIFERLSGK